MQLFRNAPIIATAAVDEAKRVVIFCCKGNVRKKRSYLFHLVGSTPPASAAATVVFVPTTTANTWNIQYYFVNTGQGNIAIRIRVDGAANDYASAQIGAVEGGSASGTFLNQLITTTAPREVKFSDFVNAPSAGSLPGW